MTTQEKISPLKAIRLNCLECSGGSSAEVKLCVIPKCPLYPFRFGKNPYLKRSLTDKQRDEMRHRFIHNIGKANDSD